MADDTTQADTPDVEGPVTVSGEAWTSKGQTRIATPALNEFHPSDPNFPVVTSEGVNVSADQAQAIIDEANSTDPGLVFVVTNKED